MDEHTLHYLRQQYEGKLVYVVIQDPIHPLAEKGRVEYIDDMGQFHGTWGGLAAVFGVDHIELL